MPYFAMIHWSDDSISPVTKPDSDHGHAMIWATEREAIQATGDMPIAQAKEITIHDVDGEA